MVEVANANELSLPPPDDATGHVPVSQGYFLFGNADVPNEGEHARTSASLRWHD